MQVVCERVAGIDVGKKIIAVAVRTPAAQPGGRDQQVRKYDTFYQSLTSMVAWLVAEGVTQVSMEATASTGARCSMPCAPRTGRWRCCWSTPRM